MYIEIPELKIKLKSLAAEARIIRIEELKYKYNISKVAHLHFHRVHHVRPISRATHVAYGLLRGLGYHQIEPTSKSSPNWGKVKEMVRKYSDPKELDANLQKLEEWKYNGNVLAQAA